MTACGYTHCIQSDIIADGSLLQEQNILKLTSTLKFKIPLLKFSASCRLKYVAPLLFPCQIRVLECDSVIPLHCEWQHWLFYFWMVERKLWFKYKGYSSGCNHFSGFVTNIMATYRGLWSVALVAPPGLSGWMQVKWEGKWLLLNPPLKVKRSNKHENKVYQILKVQFIF